MDKMSIGETGTMDKMSVGENDETADRSPSMDKMSNDQRTKCPLEPRKDRIDNIDIYPILPSNPSLPGVDLPEGGADGSLRLAEARLAASAVNRRGLDRIHEPLSALIAQGFSIEEVQAAWDRRQDDARETVSGDRFMPNLSKWLADQSPQGAWSMLSAERSAVADRARGRVKEAPELELCTLSTSQERVWGCRPVGGGSLRLLKDENGNTFACGAPGSREAALRAMAALSEKIA